MEGLLSIGPTPSSCKSIMGKIIGDMACFLLGNASFIVRYQ